MDASTMDLSMRNVSLSLAASTRLWASSTMMSSDWGSPGRSRLVIRLSRMSGSRMWTYGAATTFASFMSFFFASYGQAWSLTQNESSSSDVGNSVSRYFCICGSA